MPLGLEPLGLDQDRATYVVADVLELAALDDRSHGAQSRRAARPSLRLTVPRMGARDTVRRGMARSGELALPHPSHREDIPLRDISYPPVIATAKVLFRVLGLRFQMSGTEHVPTSGGALLAFNHVSYIDFILGGLAAQPSKRLVRFMAKREVFDHAIAGPVMRSMHHISVDRGDGAASLDEALRYLKDGEVVGIFPEATISRSFEVKELKSGAARIAAAGGRPADPGGALGHPADDDQGPPAGLLARQDDRHPRRRAAVPRPGTTRWPTPRSCTSGSRPCSTRRSTPTPTRSSLPGPGGCPPREAARPRPRSARRSSSSRRRRHGPPARAGARCRPGRRPGGGLTRRTCAGSVFVDKALNPSDRCR